MVTTRTQTEQEQSHVGSIQVRGAVQDLIHEHEASTQSTASGNEPIVEADGYVRRDDRQYPPAYDGANPENWPVGRGVPDYRPMDRNRDITCRPYGSNTGERIFLMTMFSGVIAIGYINTAWRSTFGRLTDSVWKYNVGGDF